MSRRWAGSWKSLRAFRTEPCRSISSAIWPSPRDRSLASREEREAGLESTIPPARCPARHRSPLHPPADADSAEGMRHGTAAVLPPLRDRAILDAELPDPHADPTLPVGDQRFAVDVHR